MSLMAWACGVVTILVPQTEAATLPVESTFVARVESFWREWAELSPKLRALVEREDAAALVEMVAPHVERLLPDMAFSFGPGRTPGALSFVLSAQGDLDRWLLAQYWLSRAPKREGWEFYAAKPPGDATGFRLELRGEAFDPDGYRFESVVRPERQRIDVRVWHPRFPAVDDDLRQTVAFLALDQVLGEEVLEVWGGEIEILAAAPGSGSCGLSEFAGRFRAQLAEQRWDADRKRDQLYSVYRHEPEAEPSFPRADLVSGSTLHPWLSLDHLEARGEFADPLAGTGACYAWVAFPSSCLDAGQQAAQRGEIEDLLTEQLQAARVLGGAHGQRECCIDLLLFDRTLATAELRRLLADLARVPEASLCFFAHGQAPVALKRR